MIRAPLIAFVAALALAGCSSLTGKKEPFTVYAPRFTQPANAGEAKPVAWQLAIDTPIASDALDTPRMLVMTTPGAMETYKGGRWADAVPMMVRTLMIEAFQSTGRIAGVGAVSSGLHGDFMLTVDLYDFETQYRDGAPVAVIRLNAKLTDALTNRIVAARMFEATAPVGGATAGDASAAMEHAIGTLLPDLIGWTIDLGEKNWAQRKPD